MDRRPFIQMESKAFRDLLIWGPTSTIILKIIFLIWTRIHSVSQQGNFHWIIQNSCLDNTKIFPNGGYSNRPNILSASFFTKRKVFFFGKEFCHTYVEVEILGFQGYNWRELWKWTNFETVHGAFEKLEEDIGGYDTPKEGEDGVGNVKRRHVLLASTAAHGFSFKFFELTGRHTKRGPGNVLQTIWKQTRGVKVQLHDTNTDAEENADLEWVLTWK